MRPARSASSAPHPGSRSTPASEPMLAGATVARSFLAEHADELGLRGSDLRVLETHATPTGGTAVRLGQSFSGVPVLGGEFVVTLDAGNDVVSVLGEASPIGKVSTIPAVSSAAAGRTAVAAVAREEKVKASGLAASAAPGADALRPQAAQCARAVPVGPARLGDRGPGRWQRDRHRQACRRRRRVGQRRAELRDHPRRQGPRGLRRQQRRGGGLPVRRPGPHRGQPAGAGRRRRHGAGLPVRRRHLRLLLHPVRPRQPRRRGPDADLDHRLLPQRAELPLRERLLGRRADGVRRRIRLCGRRGRPRALPRGDRLQLEPLLLPAVRRHQRVDVRRLR